VILRGFVLAAVLPALVYRFFIIVFFFFFLRSVIQGLGIRQWGNGVGSWVLYGVQVAGLN
jgi:hypothetical protein